MSLCDELSVCKCNLMLSYCITITGAERLAVTEMIQWPDLQKIEPKSTIHTTTLV